MHYNNIILIKFSMTLNKAKTKKAYKIKNIDCDDKSKRRLLELGLTFNTLIYVEKKSLFGSVFLIKVKNYVLAIKREQLKFIEVADA